MTYNKTVNICISTNIHNERIKTKYIPSYIFEVYLRSGIAEIKRVSKNLRCSNINGAMHKLLVGECLKGAKSVR